MNGGSGKTPEEIVEKGRVVVRAEARSLAAVAERLDRSFADAVRLIAERRGRVATSGVGKAGAVAKKAAATLASTGTPAYWLHPCEALHGDLGMLVDGDVLIAFSKSGEADELVRILPSARDAGARIIAVTCSPKSSLARQSDVVVNLGAIEEACPLGLAPSSSTTAMLAVADALALGVMGLSGFDREAYAKRHPGGELGRRLLRIEEIMRTGKDVPTVTADMSVRQMLVERARSRGTHRPPGAAIIVDGSGVLKGIFTDGDLRRHLESGGDFLDRPVRDVMTVAPRSTAAGCLAVEALAIMKKHELDELPVVDGQGKLVGMLDVQDLLAAGLVVSGGHDEGVDE